MRSLFSMSASGGGGVATGVYPAYLTFQTKRNTGLSAWSDNTFNTNGVAYPSNMRTAEQTILNTVMNNVASVYPSEDTTCADDATKQIVFDAFVSQYKVLNTITVETGDMQNAPTGTTYSSSVDVFAVNTDVCVVLCYSGGRLYGFVATITNSDVVFTPVFDMLGYSAALVAYSPGGCRIDTNKFVMFYCPASPSPAYAIRGRVGTVTGSGVNAQIAVGAAYDVNAVGVSAGNVACCPLDTDKAVVAYQEAAGQVKLKVAVIVGDVISYGAEEIVANAHSCGLCQLNTDKFLLTAGLNAVNEGTCRVGTVLVDVITMNAPQILHVGAPYVYWTKVSQADTDSAVVLYNAGDPLYLHTVHVAVAGLVPSPGTPVQVSGVSSYANWHIADISALCSTAFAVVCNLNSNTLGGVVNYYTLTGSDIALAETSDRWMLGTAQAVLAGIGCSSNGKFLVFAKPSSGSMAGHVGHYTLLDVVVDGETVLTNASMVLKKTLFTSHIIRSTEKIYLGITNRSGATINVHLDSGLCLVG